MKRRRAPKDWQCNECSRLMTLASAERAVYGHGCPGCGGADIEPAPLTPAYYVPATRTPPTKGCEECGALAIAAAQEID